MFKISWRGGFFRRIHLDIMQLVGLCFLGFGLLFSTISWFSFLGSGFFQVQKYVQGQCTITEKHMESETDIQKDSNGSTRTVFLYRPSFTYQVRAADGRLYPGSLYEYSEVSSSDRRGQQAILDHFQVNGVYPCWYNPENPSEAVLQREVGMGNWILIGVFLGFGLLFATIGLVLLFKGWRLLVSLLEGPIFSSSPGSPQLGSNLPSLGSIFENVGDAFSSRESAIDESMGDASQVRSGDQLWMPATEQSPTEGEDTMSEINELVERYMTLWNESDVETRRESIAELWVEDGAQFTSSHEYRGYEELEGRVSNAYEQFVEKGGYVFRRSSDIKGHHNAVNFSWEMVPAGGGEVAATGNVFFLLSEDGRIQLDYQF